MPTSRARNIVVLLVFVLVVSNVRCARDKAQIALRSQDPLHYERLVLNGVEAFWLPNEQQDRPVLAFFHGCSHNGEHMFWLPEEGKLVTEAQNLGYHVVSFTTMANTSSMCWPSRRQDFEQAGRAINELYEKKLSGAKKVICIGASSGGPFATQLAADGYCQSLGIYIAPCTVDIPPMKLALVRMSKDSFGSNHLECKAEFPDPSLVLLKEVPPEPVHLLQQEGLTAADVTTLQDVGLLDSGNRVIRNPRGFDWRSAIGVTTRSNRDILIAEEQLNRADGQHEMLGDFAAEILHHLDPS